MDIVDLPIELLIEAEWNANQADEAVLTRLRNSIKHFGLVLNSIVRPLGDRYEVLCGNQRLKVLREMNIKTVPCLVVKLNDAQARLLSQALNHIHGEDDLGLHAELIRDVLKAIPEDEVISIIPETFSGLKGLASLGLETIANRLQNWERARITKLKNLQFKLTNNQLETVNTAIANALPPARKMQNGSPNVRGKALYLICKFFLEKEVHSDEHL